MQYDFQRASLMKRLPAWILDAILLVVLGTGLAFLFLLIFDVQTPFDEYMTIGKQYEQQYKAEYEAEHGKLPMYTNDEWAAMTPEEQESAQREWEKLPEDQKLAAENAMNEIGKKVNDALKQNETASKAWTTAISNFLAVLSLSVVGSYAVLEFAVPLLLKNGQTIGKKCFGVALMRKDGIKVTPFMMFARTLLGKCTVETMVPLLLILMGLAYMGLPATIVGLAVVLATAVLTVVTKNKTAIHDLMACTVAVDLNSQMIFNTVEEMQAHNAEIQAATAAWKE